MAENTEFERNQTRALEKLESMLVSTEGFLTMCAWGEKCKILIDLDGEDFGLDRSVNPDLYDSAVKIYSESGRLSHGMCLDHYNETSKLLNNSTPSSQ